MEASTLKNTFRLLIAHGPMLHAHCSCPAEGLFTVVTKGRDQSFSCIVIGGKVGAGPSSLYTIKSDQGL
jgi:hypothetical protein